MWGHLSQGSNTERECERERGRYRNVILSEENKGRNSLTQAEMNQNAIFMFQTHNTFTRFIRHLRLWPVPDRYDGPCSALWQSLWHLASSPQWFSMSHKRRGVNRDNFLTAYVHSCKLSWRATIYRLTDWATFRWCSVHAAPLLIALLPAFFHSWCHTWEKKLP